MSEFAVEKIKDLPIFPHLDKICTQLKAAKSHSLVLKAQTAAGKSTALPAKLKEYFSGKIIMLEPKRIAAINVAGRISELLQEPLGQSCGYSVHLENVGTDKTQIRVVTDGVFLKMIQEDPLLDGVSVVIFDEFHERSANVDLALAFLKETMAVREDLSVLIMSATININQICQYVGADLYEVPGRLYPVKVEYAGEKSVADIIKEECFSDNYNCADIANVNNVANGTILVFLPGLYEINKNLKELKDLGLEEWLQLLILHSSVPIKEQKRIISGEFFDDKKRTVILSSAIAESSLTVPGVDLVIDAGYSRYNLYDKVQNMNRLVTQRVSIFSAEQRKGRAGRQKEGKCIRLWSKNEILQEEIVPEIHRIDLSMLVLQCFEWGIYKKEDLNWLEIPSENAWNTAVELLFMLNCINSLKNEITPLGKAVISLGYDVRIACVALSGLVDGNINLSTGLAAKYAVSGSQNLQNVEIIRQDLNKRVQKFKNNPQVIHSYQQNFTKLSTDCALLCGYLDRIAIKMQENSEIYQFSSGKQAEIIGCKAKYIIALNVDSGKSCVKVYEYNILDEQTAESFILQRTGVSVDIVEKQQDKINSGLVKVKKYLYGNLVLKEEKATISFQEKIDFISKKVKTTGLDYLPINKEGKEFLLRCKLYADSVKNNEWLVKFYTLRKKTNEWLVPFLSADNSEITEKIVFDALYWYLDGNTIDKTVPKQIVLQNGKKRTLVYEEESGRVVPVLKIIIQQIFGCYSLPEICGKKIKLILLSPAQRPLQITDDLENFWKTTWPEICTEMKGRYPKHNWDYKIPEPVNDDNR